MPAFAGRFGEEPAWDLLNFVRAEANVDAGRRIDASVERWRPVTAPDFTFQIGRDAQESLFGQRGKTIVLLVFYSLPQSLPRLRELAAVKLSRLDRLGVRVVAVPLGADARGEQDVDATMLAAPDPALAACYALFTRTMVGPPATPARHVEFLIDRQGYIRARSVQSSGSPGWAPMFVLLRQSVLLNKETGRAPAPQRHAH
jgi:copper resistance protein D